MRQTRATGWMDAQAIAVWYPIAALDPAVARGRPVHLAGVSFEILGRLEIDPASKVLCWFELHPSARGVKSNRLCPWRRLEPGEIPNRREPVAFRPPAEAPWPAPLPEPIASPKAPPPVTAETELAYEPEPDDWPYPGLRLGERVPPLNVEEAEARVLRALRKMASLPAVGLHDRSMAADWPSDWYVAMRRIEDEERDDKTRIETVTALWVPTRRDNGDWDYALDWWRQLSGRRQQLFTWRAANPAYSWRQIAGFERKSAEGVRQDYRSAVRVLFEIATRGVQ